MPGSWHLAGNLGTNPPAEFLGTGDNQPLVIKTGTVNPGAVERMRIDNNGNVGIGTTTPAAKLDVAGDILLSADDATIRLNTGGPTISVPAANTLTFGTSGTERLRIDNNGNVGIGTTTPSAPLQVHASAHAPIGLVNLDVDSFDTDANAQASYFLHVRDLGAGKNATKFIIRGDGSVGIGTATPQDKLDVAGNLLLSAADATITMNSGGPTISVPSANMLTFGTSGAERLRIDNVGNVGIGTTTPDAKLAIAAPQGGGQALHISVPATNAPIQALSVDVESFGTDANAQASYFFRVRDIDAAPPNGVTHFYIRGDGAVFVDNDLTVTGDILLPGADCAEEFDTATIDTIDPGTVMVIDAEGSLRPSERAYDKRVAGVVSGAGDYDPAIVLDKQHDRNGRCPIALLGKVYCKVDAQYASICVGDLLTTSPTPGHAMKADDPLKVFGSVVGKALCSIPEGKGLIPILIALQ